MIRHALVVLAVVTAVGMAPAVGAQAPPAGDTAALWRALGANRLAPPGEAPAFALKDLAGQVVRLEQFRGQVVLAYFWTTW